jgi:hypothetical protein
MIIYIDMIFMMFYFQPFFLGTIKCDLFESNNANNTIFIHIINIFN